MVILSTHTTPVKCYRKMLFKIRSKYRSFCIQGKQPDTYWKDGFWLENERDERYVRFTLSEFMLWNGFGAPEKLKISMSWPKTHASLYSRVLQIIQCAASLKTTGLESCYSKCGTECLLEMQNLGPT